MKPKYTFLFLLLLVTTAYSPLLRAQIIATYAGNSTGGYSGNGGAAISAELNNPSGVAIYGFGNVYVADQANHVVRKINYLGIISTYAGTGAAGYSGDGGNATAATLQNPYGLAVDGANNLYIADYSANVVRKVTASGTISTVAGTDTAGYSGDGGPAVDARLNHPYAVALDAAGDIYIADAQNNVIRMVNTSGTISTVAGNGAGAGTPGAGGYSGDGGLARNAELNFPEGVAVDVEGNIYIADALNSAIRKVSTTDSISTIAGNGTTGYSGNGGNGTAAQLNIPGAVAVDGIGNIFIADRGNNVIRKVTDSGMISTVAGSGVAGYAGDGGAAVSAQLNSPAGLTIDGAGLIYIADFANNVIRLVGGSTAAVNQLQNNSTDFNVFPNPSGGSFTVAIPETGDKTTVTVTDVAGRILETRIVAASQGSASNVQFAGVPAGSYFVKVTAGNKTYQAQAVVVTQ